MLVVISSSDFIENESEIINELFASGLEFFHIRKPNIAKDKVCDLLDKINPKFHKNIALHQFHELAKDFGMNRLHFTSTEREKAKELDGNYIKSCSIHSVDEYNQLPNDVFDYCFLSPVFDSISKLNYKKQLFDLSKMDKTKTIKLIALGGISAKNCHLTKKMGFDGVVVLGSIWNEKPVESFLRIKEEL